MVAKIFGFLLFTCLIVLNSSAVIRDEDPSDGADTSTIRPTARPDGYVPFPDVNAAYKVFEEFTMWTEARDRCIADGAKLAITDTYDKIRHINSIKRVLTQWVSVGIHKLEGTDQWVRADNGNPLTSVPWQTNNPDGTGNCVGISYYGTGLLDYSCTWAYAYYVCEKPIQ